MSFGFGVSDFVLVITLAKDLRKRFIDAPGQLRAVSVEVKALSNTIRDLEDISSERELSESQKANLEDHTRGCKSVLQDLNTLLDKYQVNSVSPGSVRSRARATWKRLNFEPDDVAEIRARLTSNIGLLNNLYASLANEDIDTIKHGVSRLVIHHDENERRSVLSWVSSANFADQQNAFARQRQSGTGQWLIDSADYQAWIGEDKNTLFCPGIPGAGKTMISCAVVEHIQATFRGHTAVGICYIYCDYKNEGEQTHEYFLSSMVEQLARNMLPLPDSLQDVYQRHASERTRPKAAEWTSVLTLIAQTLSKTFFIVDGLDECATAELLDTIFTLQSTSQVQLFATSRHIPGITRRFDRECWLEIRASEDDIKLYLEQRLKGMATCVRAKQHEILEVIVGSIDGMFLLAKLWLDSLDDVRKPIQVKKALASWKDRDSTESTDMLITAYIVAVNRILNRPGCRELVIQILSWVTHTERQLTVIELQHAIAFQDDANYSEDDLTDLDSILAACGGLLAVTEDAGTISFIHYTTQEFFTSIAGSFLLEGITSNVRTAITYLSNDEFEGGACETDEEAKERLQRFPFLNFAARYWGFYACLVENQISTWEAEALNFLSDAGKVSNALQAMGQAPRPPKFVYRRATAVHLAGWFGLDLLVSSLLEKGAAPDVRDDDGRTPLAWAAYKGHASVAKVLLARDDVDPIARDDKNSSTIDEASRSDAPNEDGRPIIGLILKRFRYGVDSIDDWGIDFAVTYYDDDGNVAYPMLSIIQQSEPSTQQEKDEKEITRKEREEGMSVALRRLAYDREPNPGLAELFGCSDETV